MICQRCGCLVTYPAIQYAANGAIQALEYCPVCKRSAYKNRPFYKLPPNADITKYPVVADYRPLANMCAVCGSREGTEYHHFAPKHIFTPEVAERWPGAYLCRSCHLDWHRIIVTHMRVCPICQKQWSETNVNPA